MELLREIRPRASLAGAPVVEDQCACRRGQPQVSRATAGPFTSTGAGVTHDRRRDPREQVHVSCVTPAGVKVMGAPVHDNRHSVTHDGSGRPARQTSTSPQTRWVVMLASESAQRDSRRHPMRRPQASDATPPATTSTPAATRLTRGPETFAALRLADAGLDGPGNGRSDGQRRRVQRRPRRTVLGLAVLSAGSRPSAWSSARSSRAAGEGR
jgi:hypothetical protein